MRLTFATYAEAQAVADRIFSDMKAANALEPSTTAGQYGNIQVKEIIIRNVADSAATQAQIQALLRAIHGTP